MLLGQRQTQYLEIAQKNVKNNNLIGYAAQDLRDDLS